MRKKSYRVVFELDPSGWWVVHVPSVKGCHTQAKSLAQGRNRIREALSLFIENADSVLLVEDLKIPSQVEDAVTQAVEIRKAAEASRRKAADSTVKAARKLEKMGLSRRDAAELLGVSHQRVQQLVRSA